MSLNRRGFTLTTLGTLGALALTPALAAEVDERVRYLLPPAERPPG